MNAVAQATTEAIETIPEFKDALQFIWSALPEKAIHNAVNDYIQQATLGICVSQHFELII